MQTKVLFRHDYTTEEELAVAKKYLDVTDSRVGLKDTLVVGRYSVLPFYKELEMDLKAQGSFLINSYEQHKYIADFEYYHDIEDLTFKTYFDLSRVSDYDGPFVVKGVTNSRKFDWDNLMFAPTKRRASEIACELRKDSMIQYQDIVFRKFVPLKVLEEGIHGLPFSNEWRFFCLGDTILSYGFYWTICEKVGELHVEAIELVREVMRRVKDKVNFFVVDVAEKADGGWVVVELNDGSMSGLSGNDPELFYHNLQEVLAGSSINIGNI